MSSLETLKQELIKQKQILEEKGFNVTTQYQNPAPSEITATLNNIDGNMAKLSNLAISMTTGVGSQEVYIPTDSKYTKVRDYAYYSNESEPYRHDNFIIPENITSIGTYAFAYCNLLNCNNFVIPSALTSIGSYSFINCAGLKGDLIIPQTCSLGSHCFDGCGFSSVEIYSDLSSSGYAFQACSSLKKAVIHPNTTSLPNYLFAECPSLEEIHIPNTITKLGLNLAKGASSLKFIMFEPSTPPTVYGTTFKDISATAKFIVPYASFTPYISTSNLSQFSDRTLGHGTFEVGQELPPSTTYYRFTWYASLDDAINQINPITISPAKTRLYCVGTYDASARPV